MNLTTWHLPLLIVLSLCGLGLAVVTRGDDHSVQRWKHKAGPIDGRFVREGDRLYLYSLDLEQHELAKWEMPAVKLVRKEKITGIAESGSLQFGHIARAIPIGSRVPLGVVYDSEGSEYLLELRERPLLIPIPRKSVAAPFPSKMCDIVLLAEDRCLIWEESLPVDRVEFCLYHKQGERLDLMARWIYNRPVRDILFCDYVDNRIRLLHSGVYPEELPILAKYGQPSERAEKLAKTAPLWLAVFDAKTGKEVQARRLGIDIYPPVAVIHDRASLHLPLIRMFPPAIGELWLLDRQGNVFVFSDVTFELKRQDSAAWLLQKEGKDNSGKPKTDTQAVGSIKNHFACVLGFDTVAIYAYPRGDKLIADNIHHRLMGKLAAPMKNPVDAALSKVVWGIKDVAFIDDKLVVVVGGTGHLYIYDLQQRKRTHVIPLSEWASSNMPE